MSEFLFLAIDGHLYFEKGLCKERGIDGVCIEFLKSEWSPKSDVYIVLQSGTKSQTMKRGFLASESKYTPTPIKNTSDVVSLEMDPWIANEMDLCLA